MTNASEVAHMRRIAFGAALASAAMMWAGPSSGQGAGPWASRYDRAKAQVLAEREADWRNGAIVYQIIVDRFAPAANLDEKQHLYEEPRRRLRWEENPQPGQYLPGPGVWSHEIDFWGGDLQSLRTRLDYVEELGVDVVYLNPIFQAYTNHKYDGQDYFEISAEYGDRDDLRALAEDLHARGMRLVLDGVLNHMGRTSPWFQDAMHDPSSPYRQWYYIGDEYELGYRAWADVKNLPELRLENEAVRARLFGDPDSVVQGYLRDGADGWRLDVAFDLGMAYLSDLTQAAHSAKPGSLVIGEVWNYPAEWSPAVDAIMNFHARRIIMLLAQGEISGPLAGRMLERMVVDTGLEPLLKAWLVLDNHDVPRLMEVLPEARTRRLAQVLQFTLPGSPNIYYGTELGMIGGEDPENRAPMRWKLASDDNSELAWMRRLIAIRKAQRALRIGDFRLLESQRLLAFLRRTDRIGETVVVLVNPSGEPVRDVVQVRESKLMGWAPLRDLLSGEEIRNESGLLRVELAPRTARVLTPVVEGSGDYSRYKRTQ